MAANPLYLREHLERLHAPLDAVGVAEDALRLAEMGLLGERLQLPGGKQVTVGGVLRRYRLGEVSGAVRRVIGARACQNGSNSVVGHIWSDGRSCGKS